MQISSEYSQPPYRSPLLRETNVPAGTPGLHQGLSPQSPSVAVIIRSRPMSQSNLQMTSVENPVSTTLQSPEPDIHQSRGTKRQRSVEDDGDASRKHGKRLTTREEVSLFEICNRHAGSFGKRSDICNWWRGVAEEFTRAHGRPYSWHSVRRKVELVTKQRVKFLEDRQQQRAISGAQLSEDSMNPQWCAVLDIWIPTWARWQESEAKRIEKRDEMIRRRTSQVQANTGEMLHSSGGHDVSEIFHGEEPGNTAGMAPLATAPPYDVQSSSVSLPAGVKLPPGYESMFSGPNPPATTQTQITENNPPNNRMMNAVLETLGKLNKHLDTTSVNGSPDRRASPVLSALVQAASESSADFSSDTGPQTNAYGSISDIERIKEELRQEMQIEIRRELDRDRAIFKEKLDSVQRTQEMILQMLRQESA